MGGLLQRKKKALRKTESAPAGWVQGSPDGKLPAVDINHVPEGVTGFRPLAINKA
jgi:hypothetical protein